MKDKFNRQDLIDKELEILRKAVDKADKITAKKIADNPFIKKIVGIVETFIKENERICYGGTAINNILPHYDQFYDKQFEIPDYDFFSPNAIKDAKELADIYINAGFDEVEAKAGIHIGTYKVFVNFIPIADITQMEKIIYDSLENDKIDLLIFVTPKILKVSVKK